MLAVIVTIMKITWRSICCVISYCDKMTITGRSIGSVISYCDNSGEVYMQFKQLL